MKHVRTQNELEGELIRFIKSIVSKCIQFDNGDRQIAFEIAGKLAVLLKHNDSPKSNIKSLLEVLNLRSQIPYLTTAKINKHRDMLISPDFSLVNTPIVSGIFEAFPVMDSQSVDEVSFGAWCEEVIVYQRGCFEYSRFQILNIIRDKYESHVDLKVDEEFHKLISESDYPRFVNSELNGIRQRMKVNVILATVRQIAHELFITLDERLTFLDLKTIYFKRLGVIKSIQDNMSFVFDLLSKEYPTVRFTYSRNSILRIEDFDLNEFEFFIEYPENYELLRNPKLIKFNDLLSFKEEIGSERIADEVENMEKRTDIEEKVYSRNLLKKFRFENMEFILRKKKENQYYLVTSVELEITCEINAVKKENWQG